MFALHTVDPSMTINVYVGVFQTMLMNMCVWARVSSRPLCLMRYLPKMMRRQSRMKTITATTPPITAWSTPEGLDMAVGS